MADEGVERRVQFGDLLEEQLAATQSTEGLLMDSLDALFQVLQATEKMASDIMSIVPYTTSLLKSSKDNWRIQLEKILEAHLEGISIVRNKLLIALADLGIMVVDAVAGDLFSPAIHKAVERQLNPEYAGKVAQLIRYGYTKEGRPLRYAEVAVFY